MIRELAGNNKDKNRKTIVVVSAPGATVMEWADDVDAQIMNFFAGE